jgi:hypothetical protein
VMDTQSFATHPQEASHIHIVRPSRRQPPPAWLGETLEAANSSRAKDEVTKQPAAERAA